MSSAAHDDSFGWPWMALAGAVAAHVADETLTGFLQVYNPTVLAARHRFGWFPAPTFTFKTWLTGLVLGVVLLFGLAPLAFRGARGLRPLAYFVSIMMVLNGLGHTMGTVFGHSFPEVRFPRPMPGFYSSPLLIAASVWLLVVLHRSSRPDRARSAATGS